MVILFFIKMPFGFTKICAKKEIRIIWFKNKIMLKLEWSQWNSTIKVFRKIAENGRKCRIGGELIPTVYYVSEWIDSPFSLVLSVNFQIECEGNWCSLVLLYQHEEIFNPETPRILRRGATIFRRIWRKCVEKWTTNTSFSKKKKMQL